MVYLRFRLVESHRKRKKELGETASSSCGPLACRQFLNVCNYGFPLLFPWGPTLGSFYFFSLQRVILLRVSHQASPYMIFHSAFWDFSFLKRLVISPKCD